MSSESIDEQKGSKADRAFFRMHTVLPLRHTVAKEDEIEAFVQELENGLPLSDPKGEPSLLERMVLVEQKLDRILSLLDETAPRPLDERDLRMLELSGSGVRYPCAEPMEPGDELLLQFSIPESPPRMIRCVGRVVRCYEPEEGDGAYSLAVAFAHIAEPDRDAIIRHTLEVERLTRRAQNGGGRDE